MAESRGVIVLFVIQKLEGILMGIVVLKKNEYGEPFYQLHG